MLVLKILFFFVLLLVSIAFVTLFERKVLSMVGVRLGPNKVGFLGLLQPVLDAVKISYNQTNVLSNFSFFFYYFSVLAMIFSSLFIWILISFDPKVLDFKLTSLFFFFFLGLHTLNSLFCSWSIFSKYSMLSVLRVISQWISSEASIFLVFFFFFFFSSLSFYFFYSDKFMIFYCPILVLFWFVSFLAELSRTPCDFMESESEFVSGFNMDYGSKMFSVIFISEYSNILMICFFTSVFFFFSYKFLFFIFFFVVWIRSVLPRYRYDYFLDLNWKLFLPFLTMYFVFICVIIF